MQTAEWEQIARDAERTLHRAALHLPGAETMTAVDAFIRAASRAGSYDNYTCFNADARQWVERVDRRFGRAGTRAFLRAALARAIVIQMERGGLRHLPTLCARFQTDQLRRIARDTDCRASWLDMDADLFHKEFGIVSGRLQVAGSNLVDMRCGIPRSYVWREGPARMLGHLRFIHHIGGFRPYLQGHLHAFNLDALHADGRADFYRCCAQLCTLHPACLGLFCASWYYDPALEVISPWLAYLRRVPLAGGARLFFVENGGQAIANATATSRTRKQLYQTGRYMPRTYMFVWGREDLMRWADAHPRTS